MPIALSTPQQPSVILRWEDLLFSFTEISRRGSKRKTWDKA
jgi:hypothetical protein